MILESDGRPRHCARDQNWPRASGLAEIAPAARKPGETPKTPAKPVASTCTSLAPPPGGIPLPMAVVWSGYLTFGLVTLPVRLFSGARGERVGFHLLHAKDHIRLKQQMICPEENTEVPRSETVRGYEYSKGEYVVLSDEEIRAAAPATRREMEIVEFCRADAIDPLWFDSSYYLLPEAAGRRPYRLLERAMEKSGYVALAKVAMHNREYLGLVRPTRLAGVPEADAHAGGLLLHTMFYADEMRVAEGFGASAGQAEPSAAELDLAQKLMAGLAKPFHANDFHDAYREKLEALISAKLEGKPAPPEEKPRRLAPVVDLMESLKRSLEQQQRGGAAPKPALRSAKPARAAAKKKSGGRRAA